jgi:hypothetical protein
VIGHPGGGEPIGDRDAGAAGRRDLRVGERAGIPGRGRDRGGAVLLLVGQDRGQPVPAHRDRAAGARRGAQRRVGRKPGGRTVLAHGEHRAVGLDGQRRHDARQHLLLRALDQADVGQPGQRLGVSASRSARIT